ncbi:MAG: DUF3378 domain-containing protein, partial [Candidatus Gastranaerophilales bacterium]|nr:DUF3378 domain-containing protein [Candidatus Gastranaerophilales bacterium]
MNTYSEKITSEKAESIKNILLEKHAVFDKVQYSVWRAKTKDFQAIYYTSGKILIQGKEVSDIVSELFGKTEINNKPVLVQDCLTNICEDKVYIGTDESGKGDFFGALVIAGVQVNETNSQKFINAGIKDSKKLDDKKILQLANLIKANSVHSVVVITPQKYNELYYKFNNLNKLLAWGHARAIENI